MSSDLNPAAPLVFFLLFCVTAMGKDADVLCIFKQSCLLPCTFQPGPDPLIHWIKEPHEKQPVHSFYENKNQFSYQHKNYTKRTSLSDVNSGNASLLLGEVTVSDEGRYKCYISIRTDTGTQKSSYVNLKVHAPVREVSLEEDGSFLNCGSTEVFPKPSVSWTPHSDHSLSVKPSENGLFSVLSSVNITQSNKEYICNISTEHSWRSATYRRTDGVTWSGSRIVLSCVETNKSIKSLVWTFNRTQTIFKRTGTNTVHSPDWKSRLEQEPGSELVLTNLTKDQQGLYSCELITDLSTYLTVTEVTVEGNTDHTTVIIAVVVTTLLVLLLVVGGILVKRWCQNRQETEEPPSRPDGDEVTERLNPPEMASDLRADSSQSNGVQPSS